MSQAPVILLAGPTASGKTAAAIDLMADWPVEIVSVDSAMVFRGLDIGSAKPDAKTLRIAPHHLIDIRNPEENYSAAEFARDAVQVMREITARGNIPLLTGGTNLYFRALTGGLHLMPAADPETRAVIEAQASERGWPAMHAELAEVDPEAAARITPADRQRIQRALEVYRVSGQPLSVWHDQAASLVDTSPWRFLWLALIPGDRAALHERIATRLADMLEAGFVDEVRCLRDRPNLAAEMPSMRAVGYRQVWGYLDGQYDLETAAHKALVATRQLAKRQLTWLRNQSRFQVIEPLDIHRSDRISESVAEFLG